MSSDDRLSVAAVLQAEAAHLARPGVRWHRRLSWKRSGRTPNRSVPALRRCGTEGGEPGGIESSASRSRQGDYGMGAGRSEAAGGRCLQVVVSAKPLGPLPFRRPAPESRRSRSACLRAWRRKAFSVASTICRRSRAAATSGAGCPPGAAAREGQFWDRCRQPRQGRYEESRMFAHPTPAVLQQLSDAETRRPLARYLDDHRDLCAQSPAELVGADPAVDGRAADAAYRAGAGRARAVRHNHVNPGCKLGDGGVYGLSVRGVRAHSGDHLCRLQPAIVCTCLRTRPCRPGRFYPRCLLPLMLAAIFFSLSWPWLSHGNCRVSGLPKLAVRGRGGHVAHDRMGIPPAGIRREAQGAAAIRAHPQARLGIAHRALHRRRRRAAGLVCDFPVPARQGRCRTGSPPRVFLSTPAAADLPRRGGSVHRTRKQNDQRRGPRMVGPERRLGSRGGSRLDGSPDSRAVRPGRCWMGGHSISGMAGGNRRSLRDCDGPDRQERRDAGGCGQGAEGRHRELPHGAVACRDGDRFRRHAARTTGCRQQ